MEIIVIMALCCLFGFGLEKSTIPIVCGLFVWIGSGEFATGLVAYIFIMVIITPQLLAGAVAGGVIGKYLGK